MNGTRLHVVAPHATRTGSTRVLLDLLDATGASLAIPLAIEIQSDGPLREDLLAIATPPLPAEVPAAVLVNTCLAADHLLRVPDDVPSAVYIHEVKEVVAALPDDAARGLRRADIIMCVSERAADGLVELGFDREKLRVLPPIVVRRPVVPEAERRQLRLDLGIPEDRLLVLGCGEASERKGTDLFVEMGRHLRAVPDVHLLWVGRRTRVLGRLLDHDVEVTDQSDRFTWHDEVADPAPYLATADLLVLSSRADPQPLVPMEAAVQGTPTVAFGVDGLLDLAEADGALVAPYPDTRALAGLAELVLHDPAVGAGLVDGAQRRIDERQSPATVSIRFGEIMRDLLASAR